MGEDQLMGCENAMELGEVEMAKEGEAEAGDNDTTKLVAESLDGAVSATQPDNGDPPSEPAVARVLSLTEEDLDEIINTGLLEEEKEDPAGLPYIFDYPYYQNELAYFVSDIQPNVVHFERIARLNILHLQNTIAKVDLNGFEFLKSNVQPRAIDLKNLEDLLHRYTTAIRDFNYMAGLEDTRYTPGVHEQLTKTFPSSYKRDPKYRPSLTSDLIFKKIQKKSTLSDPLRNILKKFLPRDYTWTDAEQNARLEEWAAGESPEKVSPFVDKLARFIVAFTGGLSLVVPMLIMRIHQNPTKSLVTTSVAVVLFSGVVSLVFNASNAETLGITAAYAAVLVVFVGTSA